LAEIFDKFGRPLREGDHVLYVPLPSGRPIVSLQWGEIESYEKPIWHGAPGTLDQECIIEIVGTTERTRPSLCVKFSEEEFTLRILE
jgi:hypothetical protein